MALANLPMVPNVIPPPDGSAKRAAGPLAAIHYMVTPTSRPQDQRPLRRRSRSWPGPTNRSTTASSAGARQGLGELRAAGPVEKGKPIIAFGGTPTCR